MYNVFIFNMITVRRMTTFLFSRVLHLDVVWAQILHHGLKLCELTVIM